MQKMGLKVTILNNFISNNNMRQELYKMVAEFTQVKWLKNK